MVYSSVFQNNDLEITALTDPINLQIKILNAFEDALNANNLTDTRLIVADPNHVFQYQNEAFTSCVTEFALSAHNELSRRHALRAQTFDDLYLHMSDYDYVNLLSSPAMFSFELILDKNYLLQNAKDFNTNYAKVIIPKNTLFQLGKFDFGLHHAIELRINKITGHIMALYNTEEDNPLEVLSTNILELYDHEFQGQKLINIIIPTYQMSRSYINEVTVAGHGFTKTYVYKDNFYATRIFTTVNGKRIELHQTFTDKVYDPTTPTARLYVDPQNKKLRITIPQVYFNNNQIGPTLLIELLTTVGEVDVDVMNADEYKLNLNFFKDRDFNTTDMSYSNAIQRSPNTTLELTKETKLTGGKNGSSFEEFRRRIINNSLYERVPISPVDLTNTFLNDNFKVEKYLDDLTNRIYYAYKVLTDGSGSIVHTKHTPMAITEETPYNTTSIITNPDTSITILPTTIYQYDHNTDVCTPLSDTEVDIMKKLSKQELVTELNTRSYAKSPFHIRIVTDPRYPRATSYNLMDPYIDSFIFETENLTCMSQFYAISGQIQHNNTGTGSYVVNFLVSKSDDIKNLPEEDLCLYVFTLSEIGTPVGTRAVRVGEYGNSYVYQLNINTNYWVNINNNICLTNFKSVNNAENHCVPLTTKYQITCLIKNSRLNGVTTEQNMYWGLPPELVTDYQVVYKQTCRISLGDNLSDIVYNDIDIQRLGSVYATHQTDVQAVYTADEYELNDAGTIKFTLDDDGNLLYNKLHEKGDLKYDDSGKPILLHKVGDPIIDTNGAPVIIKERISIFYVGALMIDAKIYASEHPTQIEYRNAITSTLMEYFKILRTKAKDLLEQTRLYFRPINTLGNAKFNIGNWTEIIQPLAGSYKLRCHVPDVVLEDVKVETSLQESIIKILEREIQHEVISLSDIAKIIKNEIPEYVFSVDILGINNNFNLQTMSIMDTDSQPSLAQELWINKNGDTNIRKKVDIEFIKK